MEEKQVKQELTVHLKTVWENTFVRMWNPTVAAVFVGLLSAFYFGLTGTVWAVTGEFTRIGAHLMNLAGVDTSDWSYLKLVKFNPDQAPWLRTDGWIVFGMLFGALISTLFANNFKIRVPLQKRRLVQGFVGGIIAGFGAGSADSGSCNSVGICRYLHVLFLDRGVEAGDCLHFWRIVRIGD
jgi:hypothetical protein